jgi:hypothetical protein
MFDLQVTGISNPYSSYADPDNALSELNNPNRRNLFGN